MTAIRLILQFALRNPETNLFWDGVHRVPYFGFDTRGNPSIGMYNEASENWKPSWSKDPKFFESFEVCETLWNRYVMDREIYPFDIDGAEVPKELEMVKFQTTTARNYIASDELSKSPFDYFMRKDQKYYMTKMRLCLGSKFHDAYEELVLYEQDYTDYKFACSLKKSFRQYTNSQQKLFDYKYARNILFLKNEQDLILAKMLVADGLTNVVDLISFRPLYMEENDGTLNQKI